MQEIHVLWEAQGTQNDHFVAEQAAISVRENGRAVILFADGGIESSSGRRVKAVHYALAHRITRYEDE
jgi:hypothetical protein